MPDETRVYESVGRMFILSDKPTVTSRLTEKQSSSQEKVPFNSLTVNKSLNTDSNVRFRGLYQLFYISQIKTLESNKEYLERNLKESENSLRELVAQKMSTSAQ